MGGFASPWKNPETRITYRRGDAINITGTIYYSASATDGVHRYANNETYYFYGYFTANWPVNAPVCIGLQPGGSWAFVVPESIVSGGIWEQHTVTYYPNGGTGSPVTDTTWYGWDYYTKNNMFSRTGYTFAGWIDQNGTNWTTWIGYAWNYRYTYDISLYAQWQRNSYLVTYNANGGRDAPKSQYKQYGLYLTLASDIPHRDGYSFIKWNTSPDGSGLSYAPGSPYTANSELTLYAQWSANTYEITFDSNGGSYAPPAQNKRHDEDIIITDVKPVRSGFKFIHWTSEQNGTGEIYIPGQKYNRNKSIRLYAQWDIDNVAAVQIADGTVKFGEVRLNKNGKTVSAENVYVKTPKGWKMSIR